MERDLYLARVKAALRGANLPDVGGPSTAPEIRFDDAIEQFVSAAVGVNADVVRVREPGLLGDEILSIWESSRAGGEADEDLPGYIAWDDFASLAPDLFDHLDARGWQRIDHSVGAGSRSADHDRIGAATVGITSVDFGVAATGSLVLAHGPGRPRSASLLVETHIAILPIDRIVHSLSDALDRVGWDGSSNIVAITGPSRTGDIESILTLGVHGPRHLHIVLVG